MTDCSTETRWELLAEAARKFGEVRLRVIGTSMLPSVWPGDILNVHPKAIGALCSGQVAVFRRHGGLVAHRVIRTSNSMLITRGDRLRYDDGPVLEEELVGFVVTLIRDGREIPVRFSIPCRVAAAVLRRSDLAVRVILGLERRLRLLRMLPRAATEGAV